MRRYSELVQPVGEGTGRQERRVINWASRFASGLTLAVGVLGPCPSGTAQEIDPAEVRAAALGAGLDSLAEVAAPTPDLRAAGILNPANPDADRALLQLGKALFWDQQVGRDGQACASCHFHAGADNRTKNQLNPNTRSLARDTVFGNSAIPGAPGFGRFGPNYSLAARDFPFHRLADPREDHFDDRIVLRDTNDVVSSQGAFAASSVPDEVFNVAGVNTRQVAQRNAPSVINAVFNHSNLWDGRAHNQFNGVSLAGPLDVDASILVNDGGVLVEQPFGVVNSSLASQAVGPPLGKASAPNARFFASLGKQIVSRRPLRGQLVHPEDSVLGPLARATVSAGKVTGGRGLTGAYARLIRAAFAPRYWNSATTITFNRDGTRTIGGTSPDPAQVFSQIEANFALFFGLAVQRYEATLVSDRSPFDGFMGGDDAALDQAQLQGLLAFIDGGNCVSCHGGAELTGAAFTSLASDGELEPIELEEVLELAGGLLARSEDEGLSDKGFANTGVRPTAEDPGRGGEWQGLPLSYSRQALEGRDDLLPEGTELPCGTEEEGEDCPETVQVDGAFKVPGLRNVELTGPYFHNGGQATLAQVVEFYARNGDFAAQNIANLDRNLADVDLDEADQKPLVAFLLALTDDRVREEQAPFDHPQLFVPTGHPGDQELITCVDEQISLRACDDLLEIPAVGADGRPAANLEPLSNFLNIASEPGPEVDHFAPTAPAAPPAASPPASSPTGIQVAFQLDPRLTRGSYMGVRYVAPAAFMTTRQAGSTLTVEARAQRAGATGGSLGVSASWTSADPAVVEVSLNQGQDVTLTIRCGGQTDLRVAAQGAVRGLQITPICEGGTIQAAISQ